MNEEEPTSASSSSAAAAGATSSASNSGNRNSTVPCTESDTNVTMSIQEGNDDDTDENDIYEMDIEELRRELAEKRADLAQGEKVFKDLESRFMELKEELSQTSADKDGLQHNLDSLRTLSTIILCY